MVDWPRIMCLAFLAVGAYVVYLYLTGKLRLGPGGKEWDGTVESKTKTFECPPPDCDCQQLRSRINYLDRRVADLENSLLKAEGLYATLYGKYLALLKERDEWQRRALDAEAENVRLRTRLADCMAELAACRMELAALKARCLEQAQKTACSPGLSQVGTLLR